MDTTLKQSLGLFDTTILCIGNIIGAGVFVLLGNILRESGSNVGPVIAVAMILNICAALCYAELGTMYKSNSTEYLAIKDSMGPTIATASTIILVIFALLTISTLALMLGTFLTDNSSMQFYIALAFIFLLSAISYFGIEFSKSISNILGSLKLTILIAIIGFAVFCIKFHNIKPPNFPPTTPQQWHVLLYVSFMAIFLFNGYDAVVKMTDEIVEPEKTIPKALIMALIICSVVYILIAIIGQALNIEGKRPINEIIGKLMKNNTAVTAIYWIGIITIFNTTFLSILALSRFIYGLAKETPAANWLAQVNPNYQTPHNCIILVFLLASALLLVGNFEKSVILSNVFLVAFLFLLMLATLILRSTQPNRERPFKVPFHAAPAVIGIIMILLYAAYFLFNHN